MRALSSTGGLVLSFFGGEEVVVEVEVEEKCRRRDVSLKDAREPGAPSAATDENREAAGQHGLNFEPVSQNKIFSNLNNMKNSRHKF